MKAKFSSAMSGAILFAGLASQSHAAQTVSAPVLLSQSTEPTGVYYEQNGSNICGVPASGSSGASGAAPGTATVCKIDFAAAPTGKYLVIEHVACNLWVRGETVLTDASLASASGLNEVRLLPLRPTPVAQGESDYYAVNDGVLYATRSVPRIVMHSETEAKLSMTCQISGHLNVNK